MASEQAINYRDLLLVLRRRPLFVLFLTSLFTAAAGFGILQIPDVYTARSVIFLEQGRLPKSFQQAGVIVPPLDQWIGRLRQEVLSREVLREVVSDLSLYERGEMDSRERDQLFTRGPKGWLQFLLYRDPIERAREDIRIEIVKRNGQEFIEVSADARSAEISARVVNRIADILASKNRDLRIRKGEEVESFLEDQVGKARVMLEESEDKLKRFRAERQETLPENAEALNSRLSQLANRSEDRVKHIRIGEAERARQEFRIAALLKQAARDYEPEKPTTIRREKTPEESELESLLRQDEQFSTVYKASHPLRKQLLHRIQLLQERVREILAEIGVPSGDDGEATAEGETPAEGEPEAGEKTAGDEKAVEGEEAAGGEQVAEGEKADGEEADGETADGEESTAGGNATAEAEPTQRSIGIWNGRIDQERIVERLVELNASPELLEDVQNSIARIAVLTSEIEALAREQERELREIDRLEMMRAALPTTRVHLAKIEKEYEDSLKTYKEIATDWDTIQKFLAAERAMRGDQLRVLEAAEAPLLPAAPNRPLLAIASLGASLLLSLSLGALLEKGRKTYRSAAEVEEDLGLPVLATLPSVVSIEDEDDPDRSFLSARNRTLKWLGREQLHRLRCAIGGAKKEGEVRSVLVTSSIEGEGKTLVATGLAYTIARSLDHWSLLIETDLRRPAVAERFQLEPGPGLAEHIMDGVDLSETIRPAGVPKFSIVCAGEKAGQVRAALVIDSSPMQRLAEEVRSRYQDRFVVYDAPPVLPTPDPLSIARLVDGIVFVVHAGKTPRKLVKRAIAALPADKILGIVLNRVVFDRKELRYLSAYYAEEQLVEDEDVEETLDEAAIEGAIDYDAPTEAIRAVAGALPEGSTDEDADAEPEVDDGLPRLRPLDDEVEDVPDDDEDDPGSDLEPRS